MTSLLQSSDNSLLQPTLCSWSRYRWSSWFGDLIEAFACDSSWTWCYQARWHFLPTPAKAIKCHFANRSDSSHDKTIGLDGADDYVVKPFDQEELRRVRALLCRGGPLRLLCWSLRLDLSSCEVTYGTRSLHLTRSVLCWAVSAQQSPGV